MTQSTQVQIEAVQDWKQLYEFMCGLHTNLHFEIDRLKVEINRIIAAAQVGEQDWQHGYEAGMKSAAPAIAVLQSDVAATIERCAQVAEKFWVPGPYTALTDDIAAAIREIKDAP